MAPEALAVVHSWLTEVNRRDGPRLEALSSPQIEIVGPRGAGRLDRAVLSQWLLRSGFSATPKRWFCGGDGRVVVEHHARRDDVETGDVQSTADTASQFVVVDGMVDRYVRHDTGLDAALDNAGLTLADEVTQPRHGVRR